MIHLHTIRRTSSFEGSLVIKHEVNSHHADAILVSFCRRTCQ